jgi:NADH:ubiquinone oxidoreductase subunit 3 (subunit A)
MTDILLSPLVAFGIYCFLVAILSLGGRIIAVRSNPSEHKSSSYAGGEEHYTYAAAPGYRPFFIVALFFAVLHLGVLMIGTSDLSMVAAIYLGGLILALVALILG